MAGHSVTTWNRILLVINEIHWNLVCKLKENYTQSGGAAVLLQDDVSGSTAEETEFGSGACYKIQERKCQFHRIQWHNQPKME